MWSNELLIGVEDGDVVVTDSGYTFTWDNHGYWSGVIYRYNDLENISEIECYATDVIEVIKKGEDNDIR